MHFRDTFLLSLRSIRGNPVRTGITITIIALGIMALIGIITAISAMEQKLSESFSSMGANGFTIRFRESSTSFHRSNEVVLKNRGERKIKKSNEGKPITFEQAVDFKSMYEFPATVGISVFASNNTIVSSGNKKTNPVVRLIGGDENYLDLNGYKLDEGRGLSPADLKANGAVCIIGNEVATHLFRTGANAVDQIIRVNNIPFRVIGVMAPKGSSFGFSQDNIIITSCEAVKQNFSNLNSFSIGVKVDNLVMLDMAMGEAEAVLRSIRKLNTTEENNFYLDKSDKFAAMAIDNTKFLTLSAMVIGLITLAGAAIGLMNIMLVAVTERTKEVGLIKSIGGLQKSVQQQFLLEAVLISVLGGIAGIIAGILIGNLFAMILGTGFVIPWMWVMYGFVICTIVGLSAGYYPAAKASKLNPIEALRYE